jgi:hypothetical protein
MACPLPIPEARTVWNSCVACGQPHDGTKHVVWAIVPRSDGRGHWTLPLHPVCAAAKSTTGQPSMTPGDTVFRGRSRHPDCERCGKPYVKGHLHQRSYAGDCAQGWTVVSSTHECEDGGQYRAPGVASEVLAGGAS